MKVTKHKGFAQVVFALLVVAAMVLSTIAPAVADLPQPYTFTGHVYQGYPPDATTPVSGVTVGLWGDEDEWPEAGFVRVLLTSTTTNLSGVFSLSWEPGDVFYPYFHIIEVDPSSTCSTGAQAEEPGYVKNFNVVSYLDIPPDIYSGSAFWDQPTPLHTPAPPPEGWCCLNGEVFPASEAGCYDEGGSFFGTQEEAEDYCRGEMPPEGWCCLNGEVFPASEAGCYDEGGSFFGTQEEAEDYCRGEMPPEGWCCLNGEVFPSSDVQCSDEGGSFFATREEAEDYCRGEIKDEIIGSSDGTAGQTFTLTKIPVISEEIWVNEFDALSEEEMDNIVADGNLEVEEVQDENRNTTEFWIKWRAVDDLLASSNDDRHYEIDRERGIITFGDGTNGAIPPVGVDNIKANYRYGVATLTPTFMPTPQPDIDLDGVTDAIDNCLNKYNPNQEDYDNDGVGDVCDCSDGIKGGDEENVDCGGSFCVPCDLCNAPMSQFPYSFDWRNWKGTDWMSPVKDQDGCGSCWAFAAVGAVEAKYNIERNTTWQTADLSEQNLVSSCCTGGSCSGGNKNAALLYIKNSGIVDETCFPYQSQQCWLWDAQQKTHYCANQCSSGGTCSNPVNCNTCAGGDLWKIKDFHVIKFTKEEMTSPFTGEKWITTNMVNEVKRALVCHGPLAICSGKWGHCIVLVGWDDATGNWIIKNSWGTGWGNNGYGTIPYANHDYSDFIWYGPSYPEDVYRPGVHVAPAAHIPNAGPSFALVNPAAAYCSALGYEYVVETGEQGERGLCQFPDGQTVDAWEFLQGKVAPEYSYCEIRGCEIKTVTDPEKCLIFGIDECAVCSLEDGTEVEVTELMGLSFEESTCGDQTCGFPENFSTCPEDCASGEWDAYCDGVEDGKCDPDCLPEDDPDCKIFPWALVSSIIGGLLAILTVAAIIVYLRVFRRKKASAQ